MKKIIYICWLLSIVLLRMQGQSLLIEGSRVELSPGDVPGAAFYEDKGMFVVQQYVHSPENGVLLNGYFRQLSSWNIESHTMISKRVIDDISVGPSSDPCGRVEISTTSHRIYVCSAKSHLEIMDPDSLGTIGTMAQVDGQTIIDFAVDDFHRRVLVLSARKDGTMFLTSYSLPKGEKQQETVLLTIDSSFDWYAEMSALIIVSQAGQIGIYLDDRRGLKSRPGIYMCQDSPDLVCTKATDDDRATSVSEMSFLGPDILAASSKLADSKSECILSVSPGYRYSIVRPLSFGVSRKYCSPTGVHYAVGVVDDKYLVGFTGMSEYNPLTETWKTVSSSFSVWRAGISKTAAVVEDPADCATPFCGVRIAASKTKPFFITYQKTSSKLFLYSIADH
ncbi:MAG TPA: hypothetical protein VGD64_04970 [Acidisarcina sp.]